jgi:hypothetical protein
MDHASSATLGELASLDRAPGSDFRLTDRYAAPADLLERMGCVPADGPIRHAVKHLIGCCLIGWKVLRWTSYSRGHSWYSTRRKVGYPFTYVATLAAVDLLVAYGWIDELRAAQDDHLVTQMQSSFRPTQKLLDLAANTNAKVIYFETERPTLIVRDKKGNDIPIQNTRQAVEMQRAMDRRNEFFKNVSIELKSERIRQVNGVIIVDDRHIILTTPYLTLTQICSRGTLSLHRRLYTWVQNLPSSLRSELLINREETIELDYRSMHPRMLYALRGIDLDPDFDPYDLEGYPRQVGKLAMLVGVSSRSLGQAIGHLIAMKDLRDEHGNIVPDENGDAIRVRRVQFRDGTRWEYSKAETRRILLLLKKRNPAIADLFCSDAGIHLMTQDSRIACEIVDALMSRGIVCIPIHDSFIVQKRHEADLKAEMDAAWSRFLKRIPSLKSAWLQRTIHSTKSKVSDAKILHDGSRSPVSLSPGVGSETRVSNENPGVTHRDRGVSQKTPGVTNARPTAQEVARVDQSVSVALEAPGTAKVEPVPSMPVLPRLPKRVVTAPVPVARKSETSATPVKLPSMRPQRVWEPRGQAKRESVARCSEKAGKPIQGRPNSVLDSLRSQGVELDCNCDTGEPYVIPVQEPPLGGRATAIAAWKARKHAEKIAEKAKKRERKAAVKAADEAFKAAQKVDPKIAAYNYAMELTRIARGEVVVTIDPDDPYNVLSPEEIERMNRPATPEIVKLSRKLEDEIPW